MKKPIIFTLDKGKTYQPSEDLARGDKQLNTGVRTRILITLKEGDQKYKLDVITEEPDGSKVVIRTVTMSDVTIPVNVKKYHNLSFHLRDGYSDTSYTFELEFM
jgi:hypothetical protein